MGEGRGGGDILSVQFCEQVFKHTLKILQNLIVPISNDPKPFALKPGRPLGIGISPLRMLPAIQLNDDLPLVTNEVDDVIPNRRLPPKPEPAQLPVTNPRPKPFLGLGERLAQPPGNGRSHRVITPPTLSLPHKGGGNSPGENYAQKALPLDGGGFGWG